MFAPHQQINGLVGSKLDIADEFMNDPADAACSDEAESRGKADNDAAVAAAGAPNAKKVSERGKLAIIDDQPHLPFPSLSSRASSTTRATRTTRTTVTMLKPQQQPPPPQSASRQGRRQRLR